MSTESATVGGDEGLGDLVDVDFADPLADLPAFGINHGQMVTGHVFGGMHQTINNEYKLLRGLISAHQLTPEYVARVMDTFVDRAYRRRGHDIPLNREAVTRLLVDEPCVVLVGAEGTGLTTAAVALLHAFGRRGWRLEQILIDEEDNRPFIGTDLPAEPSTVYLLRLPRQPHRISPDFVTVLQAHAAALRDLGAHLVVTVTDDVWRLIRGQADVPVLDVEAPNPTALVVSECSWADVDGDPIISHPAISSLLGRASVTDAARLARIIITAVRHNPDADLGKLVGDVSGAYGDWDDDLAQWFADDSKDLRSRLFLVAAAMLEGTSAAEVLSTVNALGLRLGDLTEDRTDGLAEAGLRALTSRIGAKIVDGRLEFARAQYAEAVLTFVHADRSSVFRRRLWEWATMLPMQRVGGRSTAIAARVTEVMVRTVLRRREVQPLLALSSWAVRPHLREHVITALTATAVSDEVGADVRNVLYRWARYESNEHLLTAVAEVCAGDLADSYPRISLKRLEHLANRQHPAVTEAVTAAVVRLWERPKLRPHVLEALTAWASNGSEPQVATAWRTLTALAASDAHPIPLADAAPQRRDELVRVTARLLDGAGSPEAFITTTLDAAVLHEQRVEPVIQFFVDTVRCGTGGTYRLVRINKLAYKWQPVDLDFDRPDRRDLRDRLNEALHLADPLTSGG